MNFFTVGTVIALDDPSSFTENPDDRIENVPCIDGTYLEDLGLNLAGTTYDVTLVISTADYATLLGYRATKTAPLVIDHRGRNLGNRGFKIKSNTIVLGCDLMQVELQILKAVS
jgi:hypothetical protein